jgi:hypothetical protein
VRVVLAIVAFAFVLFVVTVARRSSQTFPVSDDAIIELSTLNAAQGQQLLGPYSRYAWHHPGPALFYVLAPFYRASGSRSTGLAAGALTINVAAIAVAFWLLCRSGGAALAVALAVAGAFYIGRLGAVMASPWNAHAVILPSAALIIVSAAAAAGSFAAVPAFVVLSSFVLQSHVATLPIVVVCAVVVVVRAIRTGVPRGVAIASAVLLIAAWAAPVIEQVTSDGGNVTKMWQFVGSPSGGVAPAIAFEAWADMLTAPLSPALSMPRGLLLSHDGAGWRGAIAVGELIALVGIGLWAFRQSRPFQMWLAIELLCIVGAGLLAVLRIPDGIHDHEVFWLSTAGLLTLASALALPLAWLDQRLIGRAAVVAGVVVVAGVSLVGFRQLTGIAARSHVMEHGDRRTDQATRAVEGAMVAAGSRRLKILMDQPVWETAAGVVLQLRKKGVVVAVQPGLENMFSGTVAADGTEDLEITFCGGPCHERLSARPGNAVVLFGDGLAIDAIALK